VGRVEELVGDIRRRQAGHRDLVQQRLEQMMVGAIDEGDAHRRIRERAPEARVLMATAFASIELAGPPARLRSNFTNGLKRLPVRVVERRAT